MWVQVYDNDAGRGVTVATVAICAPMAPLGKLGLSLGRSEICFYLGNLSSVMEGVFRMLPDRQVRVGFVRGRIPCLPKKGCNVNMVLK